MKKVKTDCVESHPSVVALKATPEWKECFESHTHRSCAKGECLEVLDNLFVKAEEIGITGEVCAMVAKSIRCVSEECETAQLRLVVEILEERAPIRFKLLQPYWAAKQKARLLVGEQRQFVERMIAMIFSKEVRLQLA